MISGNSTSQASLVNGKKLPEKVRVDIDQNVFMVYPRQSVLITSAHEGKVNVAAIAWTTVLSCKPPMHGFVISPHRYTHELVSASKKFIMNIPERSIIAQVVQIGSITGRKVSKFKQVDLTPIPSLAWGDDGPPRIAECPVHVECEVRQAITIGDSTLFAGEVVACSANAGLVKNGLYQPGLFEIPYHLGGHEFEFNNLKIHSF
ncbi:MAG: flavin reductase family protein [Candidatus Sigynarchaeota archaeon]